MELDLQSIVAIATTGTTLGLFAVLRGLRKDIRRVINKYKEVNADGKIDEVESKELMAAAIPAIESLIKIGYLVMRMFGKRKR